MPPEEQQPGLWIKIRESADEIRLLREQTIELGAKLADAVKTLEFYATFTPRYHPGGFYEIHIAPGEGGEVKFGTQARACLARLREEK